MMFIVRRMLAQLAVVGYVGIDARQIAKRFDIPDLVVLGLHRLVVSSKTRLMFHSLSYQEYPSIDINFHDCLCPRYELNSRTFNSFAQCVDGCFTIELVDNFKYLGILLDKNLNWRVHTNSLKSYFQSTLRKIYMLKKFCSTSTLKMVYNGLFQSKLNYGITCWGGAYFNKIRPLLILQKYAIRQICKVNNRTPSFSLFKSLSILPVRHLFYFKVLKFSYLNNTNQLTSLPSFYNLRSSGNVQVPAFRTTSFRNSFPVLSCRLFNKMPVEFKTIQPLSRFLRLIKIWLLTFNFNDIEILLQPSV